MDHNPYSPPQANTELPVPKESVRRPISVWLLIILLWAVAIVISLATARLAATLMARWSEVTSVAAVAITMVWRVFLIAIFIAAAVSAFRRRPWSRWFGVAIFVLLAAYSVFTPDKTQYLNDAERMGGMLGRILMPILLAWWTYAIAFSSKSKQYFSKGRINESEVQ